MKFWKKAALASAMLLLAGLAMAWGSDQIDRDSTVHSWSVLATIMLSLAGTWGGFMTVAFFLGLLPEPPGYGKD